MLRALTEILLPPRCASCSGFGRAPLCAACEARIRFIGEACRRCAAPLAKGTACRECPARRQCFERAASAAVYEGPVRDSIVAFKVLGERRFSHVMARWLVAPARTLDRPDVITWVPSAKASALERGFVPAEEIARAFAKLTGGRARGVLDKNRETADQHGLTIEQRFANLDGAFRARPNGGIVLVVDDVLTTGATASACAKALLEAGARQVQLLTVARAAKRARRQAEFPISARGAGG